MDIVCGLRYESGIEELETEEQLFSIFTELKENYNKFRENFEISDCNGDPIDNFSDFLVQAINEEAGMVFLKGSGEIAGLSVKNATLEYNLGDVVTLTEYWDIHRARDCYACHNKESYWVDEDTKESECKKDHEPMNSQKCGDDFDSHIKNSKGKAARTLQEMVEAAVKI